MTDQLPQKSLTPPIPANETERLSALHRYKILDTPPEVAFDRITTLAARLFKMPIVLISLVDESRAWFKSCIGFNAREVPRDATLCSFAVLTDEPLIIPDTRLDARFACNPFVQSEPGVRFYAGAPLLSHDGFNLGTLCLLDTQPHEPLTVEQQATLVDLAAMVVDELELRLAAYKIAQVDAALLKITQGVSTVTGGAFFEALVQHFAKVLDTDYVYIGLVEGDDSKQLRTIATFAQGQIVDNLTYPLQDTPCWEVIGQRKICCYPHNVQAHFPNAPLLKPLSVESYIAAPFYDSNGIALGLLGVMDGKPLENVHLAESLLTIFASRIATELERQQAEIALQESEQRYRSLAIATSSIVWVAAGNGEILSAPAWEAFTGQTPEQLRGWGWFEMVHPDERENTIRVWTHGLENKISCEVEHRLLHRDGQYRHTVARAVPILDDAGHVREWVGTVTDINERKQAEALLQASHDTFRHLVENSPFGLYAVDADFRLAQVSAGAQKVFENVRSPIGRDFAEALRLIWLEPFASEAIARFRHTLKTGEPYHAPSTTERRHDIDEVESYDWKIERITLPDGRFGVVCHFYDLSERQRYEAALHESKEQFRNLADSSPVLIWQTDEAGVTFVNRYYLEFFAQTLDGVKGMGWANFLHPDDAAAYVGAYRAAFESQERYKFQCRFLRHDGESRWLQNVGEPHYGLDRTFLGFVGCSVDVTDIKAVEAELQASEERFRNMADNAPMMVWVTDTTGYCTYLSRSWYDFTGQTEETGLGLGWLDATHPDDRKSSQAIFLAAHERQEAFQLEYRLRHQDGRYRTCLDAAKPWFGGDGKFKGYIGSVIDIDERKQAERELQQQANELTKLNKVLEQTTSKLSERNQELDRFVYTVSHDLKAPLRAIYNLSSWMADDLEGQLDEENLRQMQLLQSRVVRMEALINGLLAYSRIGRTEIVTERVKVGELLSEILDSLTIPSTFTIFVQPEMPTLFTKRLLLSQVFSNLISNAIKYNDRLDGRLEIRANQKGEYYEFSVSDNGPGIAPENHERVFEIFQMLKGQEVPESTGIGLSIVKKIIETEGGSIILESNLGEGATFRFTWGNRHEAAKTGL